MENISTMRARHLIGPSLLLLLVFVLVGNAAEPPLKLVRTMRLPADIKGGFDHLTADVPGNRLFVAAERHGSVEVLDVKSGKIIHSITGLGRPHAIFYRADLDRLYITDGTEESGALWIFDAKTYEKITKLDLLNGADSLVYDPETKYLYVTSGGDDAKLAYSVVDIIDTASNEKIGEIKIDSDTIAAMRIEISRPVLYLDEADKNRHAKSIVVIDRVKREVQTRWPIPETKREGAMALDEADHRLFSGAVEGVAVVIDTESGKEVANFSICKGTDDMAYDPPSKRIYFVCEDGAISVYQQHSPDQYKSLGNVPSGPGGRTGTLVPELKRYFVAVPSHGVKNAAILEYEVH
jgi:DNA-binding beta-propeller fold protein YncE